MRAVLVANPVEAAPLCNPIGRYAPLDRLLHEERPGRVLDIGSGDGWFVNAVAYWYGARARGIEVCDRTVGHAWDAAVALGVSDRVDYLIADLLALPEWVWEEPLFPVVNALDVLHHTRDAREACRTAGSLVAPGGYLHVGRHASYEGSLSEWFDEFDLQPFSRTSNALIGRKL